MTVFLNTNINQEIEITKDIELYAQFESLNLSVLFNPHYYLFKFEFKDGYTATYRTNTFTFNYDNNVILTFDYGTVSLDRVELKHVNKFRKILNLINDYNHQYKYNCY